MGCLFVLLAGVFPRLALLIVWIARPAMVNAAFTRGSGRCSACSSCRSRP